MIKLFGDKLLVGIFLYTLFLNVISVKFSSKYTANCATSNPFSESIKICTKIIHKTYRIENSN